ncbi:MAG TPA: hypothetical protein VJ804_07240 [Acidimicrobiales bacterium]|nr:hypothetical protein [Acidimicrobiales bacterium]
MYVAVIHEIKDPQTAFARGERLVKNEGAPAGARVLQSYPSADGAWVTCLCEAASVDDLQRYVDDALGDSAVNTCYEVAVEQAFSKQPLGIAEAPALV